MGNLIILHGTDMLEAAEKLQQQLFAEDISSQTFSEVLLQGPLNISSLVNFAPGIIIIVSPGLLSDMVGLTMAKLAMNTPKAVCVIFEDTSIPNWAGRPFKLVPGDMYEVDFGFFLTRLHSYVSFAELSDYGSEGPVPIEPNAEDIGSEADLGPEVV